MNTLARKIIALALTVACLGYARSACAQSKAPNFTPEQVWENVKWMPKAKVSGTITDGPDDIYFMESSVPAPGFIHLLDGRILSGSLQIQRKTNKSETDVTTKCIMNINGKRKVYSNREIAHYYIAFKPADLGGKVSRWLKPRLATTTSVAEWKLKNADLPAETFGRGTVTFDNGVPYECIFAADRAEETDESNVYQRVYVAANESAVVNVYRASEFRNGMKTVKGKTYHFQQLFGGLTEVEQWVSLLKAGKVGGIRDAVKGTVFLNTEEMYTGILAFDKGKIPSFAYFINGDESFVAYYDPKSSPQAESIIATIEGKEVQYTFSDDGYYSMEETMKMWDKNMKKKNVPEVNNLLAGTLTLTNGTVLKGKVAQQSKGRSVFFQEGTSSLRIFSMSQVKEFTQTISTGVTKFAVITIDNPNPTVVMNKVINAKVYKIVNYTAIAAAIKNTGFVIRGKDQLNGRVSVTDNSVWLIDDSGNLNVWRADEVSTVQVNEPDNKRVFYGAAPTFNELYAPFEAVSYYKNPYPVHCNWKATNTLNDLQSVVADIATATASLAVGTAPENKDKTINQIRQDQQTIYEWRQNAIDRSVCSVPYEEYVLIFNNTKETMIVYKENIRYVVTSLMLGCESLEKLNRKIRQHDSMDDIHAMIKYVNTNSCVSKKFDILEPTPLAAYKWRTELLSMADYDDEGKKGVKKAWTTWYKGWIQTIGGNKTEGIIALVGNKTIENREMTKTITKGDKTITSTSSSILNRKATFDFDAVVFRIKEERKVINLVYEFTLNKDVIRSMGIDKPEGSIEGQYEEFKDIEAYEPSKETFLTEEIKVFTPNGSFTNMKGEKLIGKITMEVPPQLWFASGATFEDEEGNKIPLSPRDQIRQLKVSTAGVEKTYVPFREAFVELLVDGPEFRYFRNPYPEAKAEGFTALTNTLSYAGDQLQDGGNTTQQKKGGELAKADNLEVYRKEYVFQNIETNEEITVHSGNAKKLLQAYLGLCDYFNGLDKKAKSDYVDIDNPKRVIDLLDKCY